MAVCCPKCGSQEVSLELDANHCLSCEAYFQTDGTPRNPDPNGAWVGINAGHIADGDPLPVVPLEE